MNAYFPIEFDIVLPGIEERLVLPQGVRFRYDSAVPCLVTNLARTQLIAAGIIQQGQDPLSRILEWPLDQMITWKAKGILRQSRRDLDDLAGYCSAHALGKSNNVAWVIATKQGLSPNKRVFAVGHESGHLVERLGQRPILQTALDRENIPVNTRPCEDEDFADLGGLLALRKAAQRGEVSGELPTFKHRKPLPQALAHAFGL